MSTPPAPRFGQKSVPTSTATALNSGLSGWANATVYHVGDRRTGADGWEWEVIATTGTGTSAGSPATGPTGQSPFTDNPGANEVIWARVTYPHGILIYPDPGLDAWIATSAITAGTDATTFILRAGGPPLPITGPVNLSQIFALAGSSGAVITWIGQ